MLWRCDGWLRDHAVLVEVVVDVVGVRESTRKSLWCLLDASKYPQGPGRIRRFRGFLEGLATGRRVLGAARLEPSTLQQHALHRPTRATTCEKAPQRPDSSRRAHNAHVPLAAALYRRPVPGIKAETHTLNLFVDRTQHLTCHATRYSARCAMRDVSLVSRHREPSASPTYERIDDV